MTRQLCFLLIFGLALVGNGAALRHELPLLRQTFGDEALEMGGRMARSLNDTVEVCSAVCDIPIDWERPVYACTQGNVTVRSSVCRSGGYSSISCVNLGFFSKLDKYGFQYGGPCGCPNYCTNSTGNGQCVSGACQCADGWTGMDCSVVTDGNVCNYRGIVKNQGAFHTCLCAKGSAMADCAASVRPLPPLEQVISPSTQYTSEDDYGNDNPIFNDATIATIRMFMDPAELQFFFDPANAETDQYMPASFYFENGYTRQDFDNVGFRIKGGATRYYIKKSWKISLNEYDDDEDWAQQTKLSLKSMQMDPSASREKMVIGLLYAMNAKVQRGAYAELYMNDQYMGVYMLLENVGNPFLRSRFGNDDGLLYKCTCGLEYEGDNPLVYEEMGCYDAKTAAAANYTLLTELIATINMTVDDFDENIESIFDVDLFLRTFVVEVMTGNWDGIWNANNYYLYYNYDVSQFQYFRHDLDIAFGTWETAYPFSERNIYTWGVGSDGEALIDKVLAVPRFRQAYTDYIYQLIDGYFNTEGTLLPRQNSLTMMIAPGVQRDKWRPLDLTWSYYETLGQQSYPVVRPVVAPWQSVFNSTTQESMSIVDFIRARVGSALTQLDPRST